MCPLIIFFFWSQKFLNEWISYLKRKSTKDNVKFLRSSAAHILASQIKLWTIFPYTWDFREREKNKQTKKLKNIERPSAEIICLCVRKKKLLAAIMLNEFYSFSFIFQFIFRSFPAMHPAWWWWFCSTKHYYKILLLTMDTRW